jgi:hypothetical protein
MTLALPINQSGGGYEKREQYVQPVDYGHRIQPDVGDAIERFPPCPWRSSH